MRIHQDWKLCKCEKCQNIHLIWPFERIKPKVESLIRGKKDGKPNPIVSRSIEYKRAKEIACRKRAFELTRKGLQAERDKRMKINNKFNIGETVIFGNNQAKVTAIAIYPNEALVYKLSLIDKEEKYITVEVCDFEISKYDEN